MSRKPWQLTFAMIALFMASVLLTGCPKKPAPAAGTGPGGAAGPTAGGSSGSGPGGAGGSGSGDGSTTGAGGVIGAGPGGTTGTGSGAGGSGSGMPGGGAGGGAMGPGGAGGAGSGLGAAGGAGGGAMGPGVASATGSTIPALPSPREFAETSALRDIHFEFDRFEVRAQDKPVLDENAKWLKQNSAQLLIEGHCDERGTNEYNLALGERRAKATRDYLVSIGVDGGRITVISYGEERPLCTDRSDACWAQNRRAHFLVKQ
jgi:peptidoglycan-associated lipoprotein